MLWLLFNWEKSPHYPLDNRLSGLQKLPRPGSQPHIMYGPDNFLHKDQPHITVNNEHVKFCL